MVEVSRVLPLALFSSVLTSSWATLPIPTPSFTTILSSWNSYFHPGHLSWPSDAGLQSPAEPLYQIGPFRHRQTHRVSPHNKFPALPPLFLMEAEGLAIVSSQNVGIMLDLSLVLALWHPPTLVFLEICFNSPFLYLLPQFKPSGFDSLPAGPPAARPMPYNPSSVIRQMWHDPWHSLARISRTLPLLYKIKIHTPLPDIQSLSPDAWPFFQLHPSSSLLFPTPHAHTHPHSTLNYLSEDVLHSYWEFSDYPIYLAKPWPKPSQLSTNVISYGKPSLTWLCAHLSIPTAPFSLALLQYLTYVII